MTSERSTRAEYALARLAAQEASTLKAAKLAFRQDKDPLRVFAEQLVLTSVIHAGAVEAIQRAHTGEIRALITQLEKNITRSSDETRIEVFGFWVKEPEQFIRGLVYTIGAIWFIFIIIRKIF